MCWNGRFEWRRPFPLRRHSGLSSPHPVIRMASSEADPALHRENSNSAEASEVDRSPCQLRVDRHIGTGVLNEELERAERSISAIIVIRKKMHSPNRVGGYSGRREEKDPLGDQTGRGDHCVFLAIRIVWLFSAAGHRHQWKSRCATQSHWWRAESCSWRFDACARHRRRAWCKRRGDYRNGSACWDEWSAGTWDSDPAHAAEPWQRTVSADLLSSDSFTWHCAEHATAGRWNSRQADDDCTGYPGPSLTRQQRNPTPDFLAQSELARQQSDTRGS